MLHKSREAHCEISAYIETLKLFFLSLHDEVDIKYNLNYEDK